MTSYRADIQSVANEAIDDAVEGAALDALIAEMALHHHVEPDEFAADVEERLTEMRRMRDEERATVC